MKTLSVRAVPGRRPRLLDDGAALGDAADPRDPRSAGQEDEVPDESHPDRLASLAPIGPRVAFPRARGVSRAGREGPATAWSYPLLLLFLVLLLSSAAVLIPSLAPLAPAQWVGTAGLLLMLLEVTSRGRPVRLGWPETHLLIVLLGVAVISSFTAYWMPFALANSLLLLKFVAIHLLIANTIETEGRLRTVIWVLALGGLFPAVGSLDHYRLGDLVDGDRSAWIGIFGNPNDLAYGLAVLFPFLLLLALDARGLVGVALWTCAGVYAVALFLSYSRGGLLAFGVVLALSLVRLGVPPAVLLAMAALLLAGVGLAPEIWDRGATFSDLGDDPTVNQRLETIRMGLAMWIDHPLLGVGPGCSVIGWVDYVAFPPVSTKWLHAHNTLVQLLSEMGLLGTGAFGLAIAASIAKAGRVRRARPGTFTARAASALEISLWGFLAASVSGGLLFSWFPYIVMGLISATAFVRGEGARDAGDREGPRP